MRVPRAKKCRETISILKTWITFETGGEKEGGE